MSRLIGIDIGTTNWKAGLFDESGDLIKLERVKTVLQFEGDNTPYYEPELLWESVVTLTKRLLEEETDVKSIGITGMAEAGLLMDRCSGKAMTRIIPWFFRGADVQAKKLDEGIDPYMRFVKTGLRNSYKYGISKLLWIRENLIGELKGCVWLSVPDFIAFRMTGCMATDYTLAARTFAFDINQKKWDDEFLESCGIAPDIFPQVNLGGTPVGKLCCRELSGGSFDKDITVSVCGHDHMCASAAVGALTDGYVFASLGTAAVLLGNFKARTLGMDEYNSGLSYGPHVLKDRMTWLGSIQMAGGSLEWFRKLMDEDVMPYENMDSLLDQTPERPTGMLYYPYLAGSGAPGLDINAKAAVIGFKDQHGRGDLLRGALEGIAYEMKWIKDTASRTHALMMESFIAVGGGTKICRFMQVMSDVINVKIRVPLIEEATLAGAAFLAGAGCGSIPDFNRAENTRNFKQEFNPRPENAVEYGKLFNYGYLKLQKPLRNFYNLTEDMKK